jgi:hypothetical protein
MVPKKKIMKVKFLLKIQAQFHLGTIPFKRKTNQKNKNKLQSQ